MHRKSGNSNVEKEEEEGANVGDAVSRSVGSLFSPDTFTTSSLSFKSKKENLW